ncbi:Conserved protein containing a Zn-ribbon-like motif, possibly RNA-binding [Sinosporangium album]|uniref:Conserved protein containing a Zn-ribbon-like motif, possibly RNA-binding n=1 Tax=Sinosporangium album TaxID=504805 RepID=A0A1G7RY66_9ACTN|nr:CGNR zinc finger domain-containing protein [Sinosporangium album]SDG15169.1 Conserved protein containing a Zn-ribbon-like motif, possibly RNA-binding [Sinosporangium album]
MIRQAELLRDFVNTYDVESDADEITSPAELAVWLRERDLVGEADRALDDDLHVATMLRSGLRAAMSRDGGPHTTLEQALAALPLRVAFDGEIPSLTPVAAGVRGGLARLAAAMAATQADGTWRRLKVCAEPTCRWAFLDLSKNRSRSWCSMSICGNRMKTRAYRMRRRAATGSRRP